MMHPSVHINRPPFTVVFRSSEETGTASLSVSVPVSVSVSLCLPLSLSLSLSLPLSLSVCLSVYCLFVCLSVCLSLSLSLIYISVCLSVCLSLSCVRSTRIVRFEFDFVCKRTVFFTFSSSVNLKETQKGAALTLSSAVSPLQRKKLNLN